MKDKRTEIALVSGLVTVVLALALALLFIFIFK